MCMHIHTINNVRKSELSKVILLAFGTWQPSTVFTFTCRVPSNSYHSRWHGNMMSHILRLRKLTQQLSDRVEVHKGAHGRWKAIQNVWRGQWDGSAAESAGPAEFDPWNPLWEERPSSHHLHRHMIALVLTHHNNSKLNDYNIKYNKRIIQWNLNSYGFCWCFGWGYFPCMFDFFSPKHKRIL